MIWATDGPRSVLINYLHGSKSSKIEDCIVRTPCIFHCILMIFQQGMTHFLTLSNAAQPSEIRGHSFSSVAGVGTVATNTTTTTITSRPPLSIYLSIYLYIYIHTYDNVCIYNICIMVYLYIINYKCALQKLQFLEQPFPMFVWLFCVFPHCCLFWSTQQIKLKLLQSYHIVAIQIQWRPKKIYHEKIPTSERIEIIPLIWGMFSSQTNHHFWRGNGHNRLWGKVSQQSLRPSQVPCPASSI